MRPKPAPTLSSAFLKPSGQTLPGPLLALRAQRGTALADMPLPTRKTENWKYSSRHLKLDDSLAPNLPASGTHISVPEEGYLAMFRNGVLDLEASHLPSVAGISVQRFADLDDTSAQELAERLDNTLDSTAVQLARLNAARFEDGLLIRLQPDTVLDAPLFVIHQTDASVSGSAYPRIYLDAGRHSRMTLVEEYLSSGTESALVNTVAEFSLAAGASITSVRLSSEGDTVQHVGATGVRLLEHARFESHTVGYGGPMRRHDLQVRLEGPGAECLLNGVAVTQGKQHYDNHTTIEHVAPHCNSVETYRNIAAGKSHAVFNGRIHIHQDAQKSSAEMNNKNLLLSNGAEIDTKPELEIYADDVKCAHGATIGRLSDDAIFYLVSRGISRRDAITLLTMAFINELIEQIPVEAVKAVAQERLNRFIDQNFEED